MTTYLMIIAGLVMLVLGGDFLVRGSVAVAQKLKVSPIMIGLTLLGFGTSTPELVTSIRAALLDSPGIAAGNVVGSNVANILLVLGAAALISQLNSEKRKYVRDSIVMLVASGMFIGAGFFGQVNRPIGAIFILSLLAYIVYTYRAERAAHSVEEEPSEDAPTKPMIAYIALTAVGIGMTIVAADLIVRGCITVAENLGISETVIGLTVVAIGTSLPELAATISASLKKHNELAIGNIIGSNIYNLLFILGATGIVTPMNIPQDILSSDVWIMLGASVLLAAFTLTGRVMGRATGLAFLILYVIYIVRLAI